MVTRSIPATELSAVSAAIAQETIAVWMTGAAAAAVAAFPNVPRTWRRLTPRFMEESLLTGLPRESGSHRLSRRPVAHATGIRTLSYDIVTSSRGVKPFGDFRCS